MPPIQADILARCRAIATNTWSDALDQIGLRGVLQGLALASGKGRISGPAITVKETVGPFGTYQIEDFAVGKFLDAVEPGEILVIGMTGEPVSTFGGLAAQAAVQKQAAGVVIDGGCRDLAEIQASGLWLSSRHVTPLSGKRRVKVEAIRAPVMACGIVVRPGDCIIVDETGVVCVSAERLGDVLPIAEALAARDAEFAEALRRGDSFGSAAARLRHL
jgi:regulator of RNase E activity RraA